VSAAVPRLFDGAVAVVSGAGQGLGEAFAQALAQAGCAVAVLDLRADAAQIVADRLAATGARSLALCVDVRDATACARAAELVRAQLGPVRVLVNNAGIATRAELDDAQFDAAIDRAMDVNLKGMLNLTRACLADLRATRGSVVNIASIAALLASYSSLPYAASKAAVAQATKFLARDLSPQGVRVNALAPGLVLTPLTAHLRDSAPERVHKTADRTLLKRVAEPADLVGPMLFLASDLSRYLTGVVLPVDGGYSAC
jgi:NAD(P)-dependent dehydrogenase (short-subunit alcohol dehydrogenase family)